MVSALTKNIAEFSAFKEASFRKLLLSELKSTDKLPTWSEFKEKAKDLNLKYNKTWLETEYHQTIASANMAEKWQGFERDADLYPNLKYVIVGDSRTRDKHRAWNGLVYPVNHPIWEILLPPNDWGCRCDVVQTDEDPSTNTPDIDIKKGFNHNTAKTGKIFTENPYRETLNKEEQKQTTKDLLKFTDKQYVKTAEKRVRIHLKADINDLRRNYIVAKQIAKDLDIDIEIREHIELKGLKNPEYLIRNKNLGDRKSIKKNNGITNGIDAAKKQMLNPKNNPDKIPYHIVFDLDDVVDLSIDNILKQLQRKITKDRGRNIKSLIFYFNEKAIEITREQIVNREFNQLKELL